MVREDLNIKKKKEEHNTYSQHLLSLPFSPYILMRVYIRVNIFYVLANTYPPSSVRNSSHVIYIFFNGFAKYTRHSYDSVRVVEREEWVKAGKMGEKLNSKVSSKSLPRCHCNSISLLNSL